MACGRKFDVAIRVLVQFDAHPFNEALDGVIGGIINVIRILHIFKLLYTNCQAFGFYVCLVDLIVTVLVR